MCLWFFSHFLFIHNSIFQMSVTERQAFENGEMSECSQNLFDQFRVGKAFPLIDLTFILAEMSNLVVFLLSLLPSNMIFKRIRHADTVRCWNRQTKWWNEAKPTNHAQSNVIILIKNNGKVLSEFMSMGWRLLPSSSLSTSARHFASGFVHLFDHSAKFIVPNLGISWRSQKFKV